MTAYEIDVMAYWVNHWIGSIAALVLGCALGYLYREKELFDRKKGEFKHGDKTGRR